MLFRSIVMRGIFPLAGGLMLAAAFVYGLISYAQPDWEVDSNGKNLTIFGIGADAVVGVGGILIGFVLMGIWWIIKPDFFRGRTLVRGADLVLVKEGARVPALGLPDSGYQAEIIAPDLSNLPPGQKAAKAGDEEPPVPPAT